MCGLLGHTIGEAGLDPGSSRAALDTLLHRGPDQWGEWYDDHVYLGHRRLSILDLSVAGRQPMLATRGDNGSVVMTANGEIWNYRELYCELRESNEFRSGSDSEVLLHGYVTWGLEKLLARIDGMYGFSIYDQQSGQLYVVRDRYGVKPMYYALPSQENGWRFVYASEAKAILELCPGLRAFSRKGVADWLLHRGSYSGYTPYHGIKKLLPGHYLAVDVRHGTVENRQYYELLDFVDRTSVSADELNDLFAGAVERRLMSDVPVGIQLSGGVDSSLVAATMVEALGNGKLNSFSVGVAGEAEERSDEPFARYVAERLGLTHHQLTMTSEQAAENFERIVWHSDGMLDYPNTIPIYLLSKFAKPLVTVQLTGEGADELLGGYTKFQRMVQLVRANKAYRMVPEFIIGLLNSGSRAKLWRHSFLRKRYAGDELAILNELNAFVSRPTVRALTGENPDGLVDQVYPKGTPNRERFDALPFERRLLLMDHKTYLHSVLERQDKASMGASIESRVPFVDRRLVEWAMSLPVTQAFDANGTKKILKEKAARTFSHEFAHRRKVGFPMPIRDWMVADDVLKPYLLRTRADDFFLRGADGVRRKGLDNVLLNYPDSESMWTDWFMMVLRSAQDIFKISDLRE